MPASLRNTQKIRYILRVWAVHITLNQAQATSQHGGGVPQIQVMLFLQFRGEREYCFQNENTEEASEQQN